MRKITIVTVALGLAVFGMCGWKAFAQQHASLSIQGSGPHNFVGVSDNGSFQEALDDAVARAFAYFQCPGCADIAITWELIRTTGFEGGIAAFNRVEVEIVAQ